MRLAALALTAAACCASPATPPHLASCEDGLGGVYLSDALGDGNPSARWMVIDNRPPPDTGRPRTLEVFPLFPDAPAVRGLEVAPRVIDLDADGAGFVRRRYLQGATSCTARVPARLTSCAGDTLEIVLGEPSPPTSFTPCTFGRTAPSHRERWTRR